MAHAPTTLLRPACRGVGYTASDFQGDAVPFKDRFAIAGLGVTALGRLPGRTPASAKAEAVTRAVRDAGPRLTDIDGLIGQADFGADTGADLPRRLGIEPKFFWSRIAGGTSATIAARGAIEAGIARHVVCLCGSTSLSQSVRVGSATGAVKNTSAAYGVFGPAADHALMARRDMHAYGTTPAQLGAVTVTMRANANRTGRLPVNTGGGQASWGYLQGYTPLAEAVLQLTGHGATSDRSMNYSDACLIPRRDR